MPKQTGDDESALDAVTLSHMSVPARQRVVVLCLMVVAGAVFGAGIGWGLPSRAVDPFLFGDRAPWTGEQIAQLAPQRADRRLGADVDVNPLARGGQPVVLNDTDQQRAEIIRRYRLFTYQPDEMITMMSLASMNPGRGDFDPKLYQYGGLWIYPVGALLKAAAMFGLIELAPSQAHFMDRPEAFARFYIVARLYTVLWALVGVWAVFRLTHRISGQIWASGTAAMVYALMPVVVNMSHEAKPHLPGAVLTLLALLAAGRFVRSGAGRWAVVAAVLCGASAAMVISNALALVLLPAMVLLRPMSWARRASWLALAFLIAAGVYFAANPYVAVHLLGDSTVLKSNLRNSTAMYELGRLGAGFVNAVKLIGHGTAPLTAIAGTLGAILLLARSATQRAVEARLLWAVAAVTVVQFVGLAAGKPGEYGRFALLPDIALGISAAALAGLASRRTVEKVQTAALLIVFTALPSLVYLRGFVRDSGPAARRMVDAQLLAALQQIGANTLGLCAEPAPYSLPPVDLWRWRLILLPRDSQLESASVEADVLVRAVDALGPGRQERGQYLRTSDRIIDDVLPARISWAGKPFEVWVRRDLATEATGAAK